MALSDEVISRLKIKALEISNKIIEEILEAYHKPQVSLHGESLKIYNEFEEWGWLEEYPISNPENISIYKRIIAMNQFRNLRWKEENPPSPKQNLSKWQKVMGRVSK